MSYRRENDNLGYIKYSRKSKISNHCTFSELYEEHLKVNNFIRNLKKKKWNKIVMDFFILIIYNKI